MTASAVISMFLEVGLLSLTPWERWSAARSLGGGPQSAHLIVVVCTVGLVVLLVLFCLESIRRGRGAQKATRRSLDEYSGESVLSKPQDKERKATTKNIPVGKTVYVVRREAAAGTEIKSTVAKNSEVEFAVALSEPINAVFGETWCVRYYSGSSVWEFDTTIASYNGNTLVLNHSEDVRFVNRRRFLRVSVRLRAFIARFPFMVGGDGDEGVDSNGTLGNIWAPPRFHPAVVTEIAGPGLVVESNLGVEAGERILVVLNLSERSSESSQASEAKALKVVEGIGEVKYVKTVEWGFSIATELTGLDDAEVDELIRATNAVSLQGSESRKKIAHALGGGV